MSCNSQLQTVSACVFCNAVQFSALMCKFQRCFWRWMSFHVWRAWRSPISILHLKTCKILSNYSIIYTDYEVAFKVQGCVNFFFFQFGKFPTQLFFFNFGEGPLCVFLLYAAYLYPSVSPLTIINNTETNQEHQEYHGGPSDREQWKQHQQC